MVNLKQSYRHLDQWTRSLSRAKFALFTALVVFVVYLGLEELFGGSLVQAVITAIAFGTVYYIMDPR